MKSICFFSSYFQEDKIPIYLKYYLDELLNHFTEVILLTNDKKLAEDELKYLKHKDIQLMLLPNEGYDFGMWYEAFQKTDVSQYDRVGLINDSCILLTKLNDFFVWMNACNLDYCGMVDSYSRSYHIQSYFLIVNKNSIDSVHKYFLQHGKLKNMQEVITEYEIGLSQYLIGLKLRIGAFISTADYKGEFSPAYYLAPQLIAKQIPVIKKRLIFGTYRKDELFTMMRMNVNIDPRYYIDLIKRTYGDKLILDIDLLTKDVWNTQQYLNLFWFNLKSGIFQILRKFRF